MIKVLHNKNFLGYQLNNNSSINKSDLEEVAEVQTHELEEAFGFTQNIEYSWKESSRVITNKEYRSTSVGDVLLHNKKYFVVEMLGFRNIDFN